MACRGVLRLDVSKIYLQRFVNLRSSIFNYLQTLPSKLSEHAYHSTFR